MLDKLIVLVSGTGLIIFVLWFFLGKKGKVVEASNRVEILVEGGYSPNKIILQKGRKTTLVFDRRDSTDCLEEVAIPEFKVKRRLPLNQKTEIEIKPEKTGSFGFECDMGMFKGRIIVKE